MANTLLSGQITVTTAGTEVAGTDVPANPGFYITPLDSNTGVIYVGNDGAGAVSSTTGYQLSAGEVLWIGKPTISNLSDLMFDASVSGEKVCWFRA